MTLFAKSDSSALFGARKSAPVLGGLPAWALLWWVMVLPNRLGDWFAGTWFGLPLELVLLGLALYPAGAWGRRVCRLASLVIVAALCLKLADIATDQAFGRPFNPVLDYRFPADGWHWLAGSLGSVGAASVVALLLALPVGLLLFAHRLLAGVQGQLRRAPGRGIALLAAGSALWLGMRLVGVPFATQPLTDLLAIHGHSICHSLADAEDFQRQLADDPASGIPDAELLAKLRGRDVLLVFVESYGRTVLDRADYAERIRPLLARGQKRLTERGWHTASAYLTSPTYGGISWLAHGSLLSGLRIDNQSRYDRLVMSRHVSLNRWFRRAGWRTVAVQPAHTMAWPQGEYFGYDKIYAAQDLGYRGPPFNWITMPDQYTLAALGRFELGPGQRVPLMAEIALISSHAPWTPLPVLVDWQAVGDGEIFAQARRGDAPETVWQSTERIRDQYCQAVAYSLETLISFVLEFGDDRLVLLIVGDHQPLSFVSGDSASRDVPAHLISRDPVLVAAAKDWHWSPGILPDPAAPVEGMETLRAHWLKSFSGERE
ncbi:MULTISPECIES: sulfatase-like hydrolase/transferase [Methylomonas]|uniref:Sulfatase N-terminal domain-containing protein n=1 Tax=Methylomonas koyamae TaxID=702114 RepID=A0A177NJR4_9GAMM|nr:sulfatase-like hydrolase/transferase [Methylomonas koyamae]OAI17804.1 hypothetical protein A1355_06910 [Methylomonas koyamae]